VLGVVKRLGHRADDLEAQLLPQSDCGEAVEAFRVHPLSLEAAPYESVRDTRPRASKLAWASARE